MPPGGNFRGGGIRTGICWSRQAKNSGENTQNTQEKSHRGVIIMNQKLLMISHVTNPLELIRMNLIIKHLDLN